jgi:pimeloyl-ACP methyl ester carboxylesterase
LAGIFCVSLVLSCCAGLPPAAEREAGEPSAWSRWTEVRGRGVHYLDTDPGGPKHALLIVHGYLGSTVPFARLVEHLQPEWRVVMPDLPGCGLSSPPDGPGDLECYLGFLREFSLQLGLERVVLLGSSLGCQIGARYALRHAAQVRAVVLSSPYGLAGQRRDRMRLARSEALLRLAAPWVSRGRLRRELQQAAADESLITPPIVDSYYAALRTPGGRRAASQLLSRIAVREPLEPVLPLLSQPVLVLIGEKDPLSGPQYAARLRELAPGAQVVLLPGTGHLPHLQAPEEMARRINAFLR